MGVRLVVVVAIVALFAVAPGLWRRRQRAVQAGPAVEALVPNSLRGPGDAESTWLLFTTPWCASCGPVEARLRAAYPESEVVSVDATQRADLARRFAVRSAPTVLLADREGRVQARLVGAEAVDRYLRFTSP